MKHAVITGASSGIGKETARLLLEKGFALTLISRSLDNLNKLSFANHKNVTCYAVDVADYPRLQEIITESVSKNKTLDVLINNAGLGYFDPLNEGKIEEWHEMIDTNVKGVLNALHVSLPFLIKSTGHVINLGSVASHHVFPQSGIYCASKWALLAISESIRMDLKDKVKVTTISPGQVDTNFVNVTSNEEIKNNMKEVFAAGLRATTIAESIVFAIEMNEKAVINEIVIRPNLTKD